ncbi:MAG: flavodoxin-dependent (E)-4-hydroxy-3-methylbut-2-enyl-diphosphate synthase, partial [Clostridia bacterium]|nr:flavodoxin-dependent (E)-4-hydroxy-3-methylbut-2-enyl-diphosphate synthase [Clostridia bacterium]
IELVARFEAAAREEGLLQKPLRVALMGCPVNGPGEAREADVGICGGVGEALLIKKGEIIEKIPENEVIARLIAEIKQM